MKRFYFLLVICLLAVFFPKDTLAVDLSKDYEKVILQTIASAKYKSDGFVLTSKLFDNVGSSESDFTALALARFGYPDNMDDYLSTGEDYVKKAYAADGMLHITKSVECQRFSLVVAAAGSDPCAFGGENLIADGTYQCLLGSPWEHRNITGAIWGLIVLGSYDYEIPADAPYGKDVLIKEILSRQQADGGIPLKSSVSDEETSALALTAISLLTNKTAEVKEGQAKLLAYLSSKQEPMGDYGSPEITAEVLIALTSMGIDPVRDSRFIKNGNNVLDGMAQCYDEAKGLFSTVSATNRCRLALIAYDRYVNGLRSLYDLRTENSVSQEQISALIATIDRLPEATDFSAGRQYQKVAPSYNRLNSVDKERITNAAKLKAGLDQIYALQKSLEPQYIPTEPPEEPNEPEEEKPQEEENAVREKPVKENSQTAGTKATSASKQKSTGGQQYQSSKSNSGASGASKKTDGSQPDSAADGRKSTQQVTVSNTLRYESSAFPNGIVPKSYFEAMKGQDRNLVLSGVTEGGFAYSFTFHGADIVTPMDFDMKVSQDGENAEAICSLAEDPLLLSFQDQSMPGAALFEIKGIPLKDGETLLLRYEPPTEQATFLEKVSVEQGNVRFILSQGGDYFIADRVKTGTTLMTASEQGTGMNNSEGFPISILFWCGIGGGIFLLLLACAFLFRKSSKYRALGQRLHQTAAPGLLLLQVKVITFWRCFYMSLLRSRSWFKRAFWRFSHRRIIRQYPLGGK